MYIELVKLTSRPFDIICFFSTHSYGDVVPDTRDARLFTCLWALSGVASLGIALGVLGSNLIEFHEQKLDQAKFQRQSSVIHLFDPTKTNLYSGGGNTSTTSPQSVGYNSIEEGKRRVMFDFMDDITDDAINNQSNNGCCGSCNCQCKCSTFVKFLRITVLLGFFAGLLYLIKQSEQWDVTTTVYYAIITGR